MSDEPSWEEVFRKNTKSPPKFIYGIAFTPRSGSTWLGETIEKAGVLGSPREWFNRDAAIHAIRQSGCTGFHDYFEHVKTAKQTGGVFGFEIAWKHLDQLLKEGYGNVLKEVDSWIFLRRRDFVAQAVSCYRAVASGIFHVRGDARDSDSVDVEYDRRKIAKYLLSLMRQEYRLKSFFKANNIEPELAWYEDFRNLPSVDILTRIGEMVGVPVTKSGLAGSEDVDSHFRVVSDDKSRKFVDRFVEENRELVNFWETNRGRYPVWKYLLKNPACLLTFL